MRHAIKLVIWILILAGVLFFLAKFFDFSEPMPAVDQSLKKSFALNKEGKPVGTTLSVEKGRIITNFLPKMPEEFPKDLPIDPTPIEVVKSYTERMAGDKDEGFLFSNQTVYAYRTLQSPISTTEAFEKYLKKNRFKITKTTFGSTRIIYGEMEDFRSITTMNMTILLENQFEYLITISILNIEKAHN